jgi:hypothetical protein
MHAEADEEQSRSGGGRSCHRGANHVSNIFLGEENKQRLRSLLHRSICCMPHRWTHDSRGNVNSLKIARVIEKSVRASSMYAFRFHSSTKAFLNNATQRSSRANKVSTSKQSLGCALNSFRDNYKSFATARLTKPYLSVIECLNVSVIDISRRAHNKPREKLTNLHTKCLSMVFPLPSNAPPESTFVWLRCSMLCTAHEHKSEIDLCATIIDRFLTNMLKQMDVELKIPG